MANNLEILRRPWCSSPFRGRLGGGLYKVSLFKPQQVDVFDTEDQLIRSYINAKQTAGAISIRLIASGLLYHLSPENEYFARRILIMQMND